MAEYRNLSEAVYEMEGDGFEEPIVTSDVTVEMVEQMVEALREARSNLAGAEAAAADYVQSKRQRVESCQRRLEAVLPWLEEECQRQGKRTLVLRTGSVVLRSVPGSYSVADDNALMAWARENRPEAIVEKTSVSLDKVLLLSLARQAGGEAPLPGVVLGQDRVSVSVPDKKK